MTLSEIEQTAPGVWKITPSGGSAFFLRGTYLASSPQDFLCPGTPASDLRDSDSSAPDPLGEACASPFPLELSDEQYESLRSAALAYAAEQAAMAYLARAEQCRTALTAKLGKKGLAAQDIERALDYLESCGYLDDRRFAGAWLRSRAINHAEGRRRLGAELAARGIAREDARAALDEFFSGHDEGELCRKALERSMKTCRDRNRLFRSLLRKGFTAAEITAALREAGLT